MTKRNKKAYRIGTARNSSTNYSAIMRNIWKMNMAIKQAFTNQILKVRHDHTSKKNHGAKHKHDIRDLLLPLVQN